MSEPEVLVYPRYVQTGRGATADHSSVIARFKVGQEFTDRTSEDRTVHRITRIDRDGIWGVPADTQEQGA